MLWFGVLIPGGMLAGILAQIYRYRRVSSRVERQQTKWVLFGFGVVAIGLVAYAMLPSVVPSVNEPTLVRALYLIFAGTFLLVLPFCLLQCVSAFPCCATTFGMSISSFGGRWCMAR